MKETDPYRNNRTPAKYLNHNSPHLLHVKKQTKKKNPKQSKSFFTVFWQFANELQLAVEDLYFLGLGPTPTNGRDHNTDD